MAKLPKMSAPHIAPMKPVKLTAPKLAGIAKAPTPKALHFSKAPHIGPKLPNFARPTRIAQLVEPHRQAHPGRNLGQYLHSTKTKM
jgi:hypothetical protein